MKVNFQLYIKINHSIEKLPAVDNVQEEEEDGSTLVMMIKGHYTWSPTKRKCIILFSNPSIIMLSPLPLKSIVTVTW